MVFQRDRSRRLLLVASNLYSLADSGLEFLVNLVEVGGFQAEIIATNYGVSRAREARIRSKLVAAGAEQISIIRNYPDPFESTVWSKAARYWRILIEFSFWITWMRKSNDRRFDIIVLQTENSFSDFFASKILSRHATGQILLWTTFPPLEETLDPNYSLPRQSWRSPSISLLRLVKFRVARILDLLTYNWPRDLVLGFLEFTVGARKGSPPRIYVTNSSHTSEVLKERLPESTVCIGKFSSRKIEELDSVSSRTLGILMGAYISDGVLSIIDYLNSLEAAISFFEKKFEIRKVLLRAHPRYSEEALEVLGALANSRVPVALAPDEMELSTFARSCMFVLTGYSAALVPVSEAIGKKRTLLFEDWFVADRVEIRSFSDYSVFRLQASGGQVVFSHASLPEKSAASIVINWFVNDAQQNRIGRR